MGNEEKILEMLTKIQSDVSELKSDVSELKEGQAEIRESVNRLVEWADECGYVVKFPLPKI